MNLNKFIDMPISDMDIANILIDLSNDHLKQSQEKLHELGIPREESPIYEDLQMAILRKITRNELISKVLIFLIKNDKMFEVDYEKIRIKMNKKTKWKKGNRGAIHNLTYSDHSWMSNYQSKYGDIIVQNNDKSISLSNIWKVNTLHIQLDATK